ncbi:MAG: peptidase C1 [Candidatus Kapabacteria bacterium]|nr:peptidase C1 [Ignavibacteriota bacterium]MCW5883790.1 peptidase C1 [Candidatus Kapabacteria bacterium]
MRLLLSIAIIIFLLTCQKETFAQKVRKDKGVFIERKNEAWDNIKKEVEEFEKKEEPKKKSFMLDFSGIEIPKSISEFKPLWHNEPVMQSWTGTCWSFASTSFLESEVYRINKIEIKLSEMHTVYYEYLAKVERYIDERGNSLVSEGSQTAATLRMWKMYGAVPVEIYNGMKNGQNHHAHEKMEKEINNYLDNCKKTSFWNNDVILGNVRSILNHYMGEPPVKFDYNGKSYTPKSFVNDYLKINPDDYVDIYSMLEPGYWKKVVYDVPDNWWKAEIYYNVPLDDFMSILNKAISAGYSVAIGGDVSEAGYYSYSDAAVIPSFDIPSEYIDEYARQFRFSNKTTTDDHAIHLVGKTKNSSGDWFLIKDSGSGARNGNHKGYYFYHSDYVKLKMTTYMIHKDAVKDILSKF